MSVRNFGPDAPVASSLLRADMIFGTDGMRQVRVSQPSVIDDAAIFELCEFSI